MVLAYLLVGAVVVFGMYWSIKYIMIPPSERPVSNTTEAQGQEGEGEGAEGSTDSADTTLPPPITKPTKKPNICTKGFGYQYVARSGYCYKLSVEKLSWREGAQACKEEGARLSGAFLRRQERDLQLIFKKQRDQPVVWAAVGITPTFTHGYFFIYDYLSKKRIDRNLRAIPSLTHGDTGKPQQFAFINANLNVYWFSGKFSAEFFCEYKLPK